MSKLPVSFLPTALVHGLISTDGLHCGASMGAAEPFYNRRKTMSHEQAGDLYRSDRYIDHNPSLHEEDSPWTITKILPLVDQFTALRSSKDINFLYVGGGAGLILKAVAEARRVAHFLILKVPLEDNLLLRTWNLIHRGEPRRKNARLIGHINSYNYRNLPSQIEKHAGKIVDHYYTNVFQHAAEWDHTRLPLGHRIQNSAGATLFRFSPAMTSLIFFDYVVVLVGCAH